MNHLVARQMVNGKWHYTVNGHAAGYCASHGGHETATEAQDCYKQYLLDNQLFLGLEMSNQMLRCRICQQYTNRMARIGIYTHFVLCGDHMEREFVDKLLEIGESWES